MERATNSFDTGIRLINYQIWLASAFVTRNAWNVIDRCSRVAAYSIVYWSVTDRSEITFWISVETRILNCPSFVIFLKSCLQCLLYISPRLIVYLGTFRLLSLHLFVEPCWNFSIGCNKHSNKSVIIIYVINNYSRYVIIIILTEEHNYKNDPLATENARLMAQDQRNILIAFAPSPTNSQRFTYTTWNLKNEHRSGTPVVKCTFYDMLHVGSMCLWYLCNKLFSKLWDTSFSREMRKVDVTFKCIET